MININKISNLRRSIRGKKIGKTDWSKTELISIHIPKTAGTSFYHTLKSEYNASKVVRIDINTTNKVKVNRIFINNAFIEPNPKVIHGHFRREQILSLTGVSGDLPTITWLRDPVDRVISNYYYLSKILKNELQEEKKGLKILGRMQKTLMEYASLERNRNRMTKFLKGVELEDLFFIGFTEQYDEDIRLLGKKLNWTKAITVNHNSTGVKNKPEVDFATRSEIAELNAPDVELYKKAKVLRSDYFN